MLSVAFGAGGDICFSGSTDSTIRVWRLPKEGADDPFGIYGKMIHTLRALMSCCGLGVHQLEQIAC